MKAVILAALLLAGCTIYVEIDVETLCILGQKMEATQVCTVPAKVP